MPTYCSSQDCGSQWPWPHGRPLSTQASTRDSRTITGKSGSVSCGVIAPFSPVLVQRRFCCFPGGSQSFCQMPRLGNLLWALEPLQQCKNFFAIIVLQFVCRLLSGSMVGQWRPLPRGLTPHAVPPRSAAARALVPTAGYCWSMPLEETLKHSKAGVAQSPVGGHCSFPSILECTGFCLHPPSVSGGSEIWL